MDGEVKVDARSEIVRHFNTGNVDVMLLSALAGGAGLNLIGANCLILMDASWNPADDRQAMARVWRDGQQKPVFVYRLKFGNCGRTHIVETAREGIVVDGQD